MAKKRFNIVQPSTRAFINEARKTPEYRLFDFLHGYVYSRWPYLYSASEKENTRFLLSWKCYPASSAAFFYLV